MRFRVLLAVLLAVAVLPVQPARASHGPKYFTVTGTIKLGHPLARQPGGLTELGAQCDPASPLQGVDAYWIRLPVSTIGRQANLVADSPNDVDWPRSCGLTTHRFALTIPIQMVVVPSPASLLISRSKNGS